MTRDSRLATDWWGRIGPGGLAGLQNRDGGASGVSGGFDSHTLPPRLLAVTVLIGLCLLSHPLVSPAAAQDTVEARPRRPARGLGDTTIYRPPPVTPMGAFFRSLLIPGWAQAKLERRLTGGIFLAWEGVTLGMSIKADRELQYLKRRGDTDEAITDKRQEREDWLILLAFNHLFAGLEGYVASHLWDFPQDLQIRAAPSGIGASVTLPFRLR